MSPRYTSAWPGPGRITCALLAAVPAAMAYPWSSARDRWLLGLAAVVLVASLGRWRGLYFTTMLRRRAAMLRPERGLHAERRNGPDVRTTVLLRVVPPVTGGGALPLRVIAEYLNRYGLRAHSIRITSRDTRPAAGAPARETWIGLTFSAAENLAALRARSPRIPLQETAEVAVRRLADHLREIGWETAGVGPAEVPALFDGTAHESWYSLTDGEDGYVAAYRVDAGPTLASTLAGVWACDVPERWTVLETAGTADRRTVAASCALRTRTRPVGASPLPGLVAQRGNNRSALRALHPLSGLDLGGRTEVTAGDIAELHWPTAPAGSAPDGAPAAAHSNITS